MASIQLNSLTLSASAQTRGIREKESLSRIILRNSTVAHLFLAPNSFHFLSRFSHFHLLRLAPASRVLLQRSHLSSSPGVFFLL